MSYNIHLRTTDNTDVTFRFNSSETQAMAINIIEDITNKSALLNIGHADESIRNLCSYKIKEKPKSCFVTDKLVTERKHEKYLQPYKYASKLLE